MADSEETTHAAAADADARASRPRWTLLDLDALRRRVDGLDAEAERLERAATDALESMTRLTRDNLAVGRRMAREFRALQVAAWRRSIDLFTPSWLR